MAVSTGPGALLLFKADLKECGLEPGGVEDSRDVGGGGSAKVGIPSRLSSGDTGSTDISMWVCVARELTDLSGPLSTFL
jgi:hypothetical protein